MGTVLFGLRLAVIASGLWVSGCTNASRNPIAARDAATPSGSASISSAPSNTPQLGDVYRMARAQRWGEAARWFGKHKGRFELSPRVKYLRAVVALEVKDHTTALRFLSKLEDELPLLRSEITAARLAAQAAVAPTQAGTEELAASPYAKDVLSAVDAYRRLKLPRDALALLKKRIPGLSKKAPRASAVRALQRAQADLLAELSHPAEAALAYKQLALESVTGKPSLGADLAYEKWGKVRLTKVQRFARAERFAKAKDVDAFEAEVALLKDAPGPAVSAVALKRSRAWAYYRSRRDYALAAKLFHETSRADPTHRVQDLFFSARALSRSHRDAEAAARYIQLAKTHSRSHYAEQARYRAARLYQIIGDFGKAKAGFVDYLRRYGSGKRKPRYSAEARYELSLARLALGEGKEATGDLERLLRASSKDREKAKLTHLLGLAHSQAGNVELATQLFRTVISERPLSFSALASAARLQLLGVEPPPQMPAQEAKPRPAELRIDLPPKVELFLSIGLHLAAERELDAHSGQIAKQHAPNSGRALCQAYADLNTAKSRYRSGLRSVRERAVMRAIGPDTEWIWDCIYPRPYTDVVAAQERTWNVPAGLIHAVMRQESAFQSTVVSHAGAIGLMQLMPPTARSIARELKRDEPSGALTTPALNVEFGAFYLSKLLKQFSGNVPLAVASYNAGPAAVARWLRGGAGLPLDLFVARIPYDETRGYVHRVIGNFARYRYMSEKPALALTLKLPPVVSAADVDY